MRIDRARRHNRLQFLLVASLIAGLSPASATAANNAPLVAAGVHTSVHTPAAELLANAGVTASSGPVRLVAIDSAGRRRVEVADPQHAATALRGLQRRTGTVVVGVDRKVKVASAPQYCLNPDTTPFESAPLDELASDQWALDSIRASDAWATANGEGTIVAVVDTGVDATHPDLEGQVLYGTDFVAPGGNGWADGNGHGTHVAGIIAAAKDNGGVVGVAPGADILPVRVIDDNGEGWSSDVALGIAWAVDHDADVVNLSLGGPADALITWAVRHAVDVGVSVVAAAGNERMSGNEVSYPAADPGVLSVAATCPDGTSAAFSNYNASVDLAAPGTSILSSVPGGGYESWDGTSMATPLVSGAIALVRSANPDWSADQVAEALTASAQRLPEGPEFVGAGLLDAASAVVYRPGVDGDGTDSSPDGAGTAAVTFRFEVPNRTVAAGSSVETPLSGAVTRDDAGAVATGGDCGTVATSPQPGSFCFTGDTYSNGYASAIATSQGIWSVDRARNMVRFDASSTFRSGTASVELHYLSGESRVDSYGFNEQVVLTTKLVVRATASSSTQRVITVRKAADWTYARASARFQVKLSDRGGKALAGQTVTVRMVDGGLLRTLSAVSDRRGFVQFSSVLARSVDAIVTAKNAPGVLVHLGVKSRLRVTRDGKRILVRSNADGVLTVQRLEGRQWRTIDELLFYAGDVYLTQALSKGRYRVVQESEHLSRTVRSIRL